MQPTSQAHPKARAAAPRHVDPTQPSVNFGPTGTDRSTEPPPPRRPTTSAAARTKPATTKAAIAPRAVGHGAAWAPRAPVAAPSKKAPSAPASAKAPPVTQPPAKRPAKGSGVKKAPVVAPKVPASTTGFKKKAVVPAPMPVRRTIHPAVAAAISPVAVLCSCVPHVAVSHRLLEYIVPRFAPARAVDVSVLGTTRASQLLGDLSVTAAEFAAVVTKHTRVRGVLAVSCVCHRDLVTIRNMCGAYLTVLKLDVLSTFHLAENHRDGCSLVPCERAVFKEEPSTNDPVLPSAATFAQMRHLRELEVHGSASGPAFDALITCVLAVLPTLRALAIHNNARWNENAFLRLAVPNKLKSLTLGGFRVRYGRADGWFSNPSFGLWRFYSRLKSLKIVDMPLTAPFLDGMASGLVSLTSLEIRGSPVLHAECAEALSAFPEGLSALTIQAPLRFPSVLAAYPHLTEVVYPVDVLPTLLVDGRGDAAAFKERSIRRRKVRERAVRAAAAHTHDTYAEVSDVDERKGPAADEASVTARETPGESGVPAPTLLDLSTGNAPLPTAGALVKLDVYNVGAAALDELRRFTRLRELRIGCPRSYQLQVVAAPWASLRYLRVLHFTDCAPHVESLRVLGPTLEELSIPSRSVSLIVSVAVHLPRLTTLHLHGSLGLGITKTARIAALLAADALPAFPAAGTTVNVSADAAARVLGPAASSPSLRPKEPPRPRNSTGPRPRERKAEVSSSITTLPAPSALEFAAADVSSVVQEAWYTKRLFAPPATLLHTLIVSRTLSAAAVPGLWLLFPNVVVIRGDSIAFPGSVETHHHAKTLRPYWPHVVLRRK